MLAEDTESSNSLGATALKEYEWVQSNAAHVQNTQFSWVEHQEELKGSPSWWAGCTVKRFGAQQQLCNAYDLFHKAEKADAWLRLLHNFFPRLWT